MIGRLSGVALATVAALALTTQPGAARGPAGGSFAGFHHAFVRPAHPTGARPGLAGHRTAAESSRRRSIQGFHHFAGRHHRAPFGWGPFYSGLDGSSGFFGTPYPDSVADVPNDGPGPADTEALYQAAAVGRLGPPHACRSQGQLVPSSHGQVRVVVTRC